MAAKQFGVVCEEASTEEACTQEHGLSASDVQNAAHSLLETYLSQARARSDLETVKPKDLAATRKIRESCAEVQVAVCLGAIGRLALQCQYDTDWIGFEAMTGLGSQLLRRRLPFSEQHVCRIIDTLRNSRLRADDFPLNAILGAIERYVSQRRLSQSVADKLEELRVALDRSATLYAAGRNAVERINRLLDGQPTRHLQPGEPWADVALEDLASMSESNRAAWNDLLQFAATATSSRPTKRWRRSARAKVSFVGQPELTDRLVDWFSRVGAGSEKYRHFRRECPVDPLQKVVEKNATLLKGLAWCAIEAPSPPLCQSLARMAEQCFKKIPNYGPLSHKLGNACIVALATFGQQGVIQLAQLRQRVRYASAERTLEKALHQAAKAAGVPRAELEEIAVPDFGLSAEFRRVTHVGDYVAEIRVVSSQKVELTWGNPHGRRLKSVPARVKSDYELELKRLRRDQKDIQKSVAAQSHRIERYLLSNPSWDLGKWKKRYLDHPLVGFLTHRLIWTFETGDTTVSAIWRDGQLEDSNDVSVSEMGSATRVRLWHPMDANVDQVKAWREYLFRHQVTQPFKQAHREIYVLTDAERDTGSYSNRFSSHLLKQHQLSAVCRQRGWRYRVQGPWDGANVPTLFLSGMGLQAEYDVEQGEQLKEYTSHRGVPVYVTSSHVRFRRTASPCMPGERQDVRPSALQLLSVDDASFHPLATLCAASGQIDLSGLKDVGVVNLEEVPLRVFSEVMRDIDLFVSVCSVSNDPRWLDHSSGSQREYWRELAFGDLSETARTRYDVLSSLLPQLKIAGVCQLDDRYLIVQGKCRTYKIHLGSGNVLMEPNDQYLCILADQTARGGNRLRFLPYEGDPTLSLIISKAFLLANDESISDPTIRSQID